MLLDFPRIVKALGLIAAAVQFYSSCSPPTFCKDVYVKALSVNYILFLDRLTDLQEAETSCSGLVRHSGGIKLTASEFFLFCVLHVFNSDCKK